MGLRIIYGKAGTGKSEYCFNEIAKLINKENKIYIITPEKFLFKAEKRLMDTINKKSCLNVEVLTLNKIAYMVLNEIGGCKKTNLTSSAKAMLIYFILGKFKNNFNYLAKPDENIDLAINTINEFKKHAVFPYDLENEIDKIQDKYLRTKLKDMRIIYNEFENQISEKYLDDTDLLSILEKNICKTDFFKNSIVYIDEFSGFTIQEFYVIKKILEQSKQLSISVCTDSLITKTNPDTDIFYSNKSMISSIYKFLEQDQEKIEQVYLDKPIRFKSKELKHLEDNLYKNKFKKYEDNIKDISLFLAKDQYSEIDNVAKNIIKLVRDYNYRFKDISIISKNVGTYSSLVKAIFNKYEIPVYIDQKKDLNQNTFIQYILSIMDIFNKNWSYESVFKYIKTGFVQIDEDDIFKLENYCIKWGVKNSRWLEDFKYGITEKNKQEIEYLNQLRKKIIEPLIELKNNLENEKTAKEFVLIFYNFLSQQKVEENLKDKIKLLELQNNIELSDTYKSSHKVIIDLFDEIYTLFKDDKMTFEKFIKFFNVGLDNSGLGKYSVTQDQVIIGDVELARSRKSRTVFIIGLNDGVYPSVNKDEGFFNDKDRELLKQDGMEIAKSTIEKLYEDNFSIYTAFTTAEEKLYLSYASTDSQGKSLRNSTLINKIKKIYPKLIEQSDIIENTSEILTKKTTYEELLKKIANLEDEDIGIVWRAIYEYYKTNNEWDKNLKENLQGLNYTNLPDKIKNENIEKLYGNTLNTSVSKLERFAQCPFSYYLQYGLKVKERQELKIQSFDTGSFMHEIIDEFFKKVNQENIDLSEIVIDEEKIQNIVNIIVQEKIDIGIKYSFVATSKYKILVTRLKRIVAKALKYIIEGLVYSDFKIQGTEIEFEKGKQFKPILIQLDDGKKVEITGKIDRVDIATNGEEKYLRIIDYKSSAKNIDLNEVYAGLQIQLLTYMDAICKEEELLPAGVLYFSLLEQTIKSDKKLEIEQIEEELRKSFRMKGLILADIKVIKMHDRSLQTGASKLIPATITKSGDISKTKTNGVDKEQFRVLQDYIYKTIKEISEEILNGNIALKPYYKDGKKPCEYCSYKSICGFSTKISGNTYNYIDKKTKEEIISKMRK